MRPPTLPDPNLRALSFATAADSEELARAKLCRLLDSPWGDLVAAAAAEHDALFHGLGQPKVMAHGSFDPIAGDDIPACNPEQQRRFFRQLLQPWGGPLCTATAAHPRALVWRAVADFTSAFIGVETQDFDLLET